LQLLKSPSDAIANIQYRKRTLFSPPINFHFQGRYIVSRINFLAILGIRLQIHPCLRSRG
ncbi:MAG: hypothetical protein KDE62_00785, partial [Calditrichaeota bacterium]|nr:hypothetical protein [Calditrichota bacterium]